MSYSMICPIRDIKGLVSTSGEQALKQITHVKPQIILLDVIMPGIDGFETCRRLKAEKDTRRIPVYREFEQE